jgi:hypothetical protein
MAEQKKPAAAPPVKVRESDSRASVRYFRKPEVKLIRMGREVAVFKGSYGSFDVQKFRLEFRDATAKVESAELKAQRIAMDLPGNRLTADGKVRLEEAGVVLRGDALTAVPSLSKLAFHGKTRLEADDQQAAVALLSSKGL